MARRGAAGNPHFPTGHCAAAKQNWRGRIGARPTMDVSLIICTRNRAGPLQRCLDAVALIDCARTWELVMVDNGSTDDTEAVIRAFADRALFAVQYVQQ